jgi:hypothetical protein
VIEAWLQDALVVARSVAAAVLPLVLVFLVFQFTLLRLPASQLATLLKGTFIAALGLLLFLLGVDMAFLPFGRVVGASLGALDNTWLLVGSGCLLGFVTAWGEPAVRILARQVEVASNGSIRARLVLYAVCIGVALWVGLGMLRIAWGLPLLHLLVPGYALVLVLLWLSNKDFVPIAVDAGGVATGPLANSFLLVLGLGAAAARGSGNLVVDGFGLVALIALAPLLSVMTVGAAIQFKLRKQEKTE